MDRRLMRRNTFFNMQMGDHFDCADVIGYGAFQIKILLLCAFSLAVVNCNMLAFELISAPVDHWCKPPAHLSQISEATWKNVGLPLDSEGRPSSCDVYATAAGHEADDPSAKVVPCDAWDYPKEDANSSIVSAWDLVCHRAWLRPMANAVYVIGELVASPVAGYAADHVGRRHAISAASTVLLMAAFAIGLVNSYPAYLVVRLALAGSSSAVFLVAFLLLFEVSAVEHRAQHVCLAALLGMAPTKILFLMLRKTKLEWTELQLAMVSPMCLVPLFFMFAEESPRWLVATKQFARAEEVIATAAAFNDFSRPTGVPSVVNTIELMSGGAEPECLRTTLVEVLSMPFVRWNAGVGVVSSLVVTFAFYVLAPTAALSGDLEDVASMAVTFGLFTVAILTANRVPRLVAVSAVMSTLAGCSFLAFLADTIGLRFLGSAFMVLARESSRIGKVVTFIYVAELIPTPIRGVILCASFACGRLGATAGALLRLVIFLFHT